MHCFTAVCLFQIKSVIIIVERHSLATLKRYDLRCVLTDEVDCCFGWQLLWRIAIVCAGCAVHKPLPRHSGPQPPGP